MGHIGKRAVLLLALTGLAIAGMGRPDLGLAKDPWPELYLPEHVASEFSSRLFAVRPDGQAVALSLDGDIWLLKPDLSDVTWAGRHPLGTDLTRVTRGGETATELPFSQWVHRLPTWLPDNRLVYLRSTLLQDPDSEGPVDKELWMAEGATARKVTDLPPSTSVQTMQPDPAGSRLLLLGSRGALSVLDLHTGAVRNMASGGLPAAPGEAVWSPDGAAIALAVPKDRWLYLFRLDVESGSLRRLTGFNTATQPDAPPGLAWPPGSTSLFVHGWEPGGAPGAFPDHGGIWRVPAVGGDPVRVAPERPGLSSPQWSPDGRWVAYFSRTDGYRYALHVKSGRFLRLGGWSRQEPAGVPFQWERDSRKLWYPCPRGLCRATLPGDP